MRSRRRGLPLIYAEDALRDIEQIADWNEKTYGRSHARDYIRFLEKHIDALSADYARGRPISTRPDLRYIRIQKRSKSYGHVAVYVFDDQAVTIIHVFHTAQDWRGKLGEDQI